ncbi:MAG: hypothetical protein JO199_06070 [Candidatus Eremiobacteraeota bacterium]|nr:hypothetical protein [Candidatus Eremiobacteraeota bacterium]
MKLSRFAAFSFALAMAATGPVLAAQGFGGFSFGNAAEAVSPDEQAAAAYCTQTGGTVYARVPVYGTNNSAPSQQLVLSGRAGFCEYGMKMASFTSYIDVLLSTLYTTKPTLAALAYYSKTKVKCSGSGSPASCYCSQLGGTDLFGGVTAAGGAWVNNRAPVAKQLDTCIFPDLSSIDSWGLTYHANGIVRGKDLSKVLRYKNPFVTHRQALRSNRPAARIFSCETGYLRGMSMKTLRPDEIDTATAFILDVRARRGAKQIRGSLYYDPKELLKADPLVLPLPHDGAIAVYGDSDTIVAAVVDKLERSGYSGAARLDGGYEGWHDAGLPIEGTTEEQPVPGA